MFVYIRVPTVPRADRIVETIDVPDPWSSNTRTRFEITDFVLVAEATGRQMGGHWIGLRNTRNGEQKMLPEALVLLWREKKVRSEQLPALLHASGNRFILDDSNQLLSRRFHKWMASIFLLCALLAFGFAAASLVGRSGPSHAMHEETLASLSARPLVDYESIRTSSDSAPVIASVPLDASPPKDAKLIAMMPGAARLTVVQMGMHKRLLWTAMPPAMDRMALVGVVWPANKLDPSVNAAIDELARRVPDVERAQVFGQMWTWTDAYGGKAWIPSAILGVILLLGAALVHEVVARQQRRRLRDAAWLEDLARKLFKVRGMDVVSAPR